MSEPRPKNIEEYKEWLKEKHGIELLPKFKTHYESATARIQLDLQQSDFWRDLGENLREYNYEFHTKTGYFLLASDTDPAIKIKPFDSFILKTFRKNIQENPNWPSEPQEGWILPANWFSRISDVVRTLLVVKYLDGVDFLREKIKTLCDSKDIRCKCFLEAREDGYYAAHLYATRIFEVPEIDWDTEKTRVSVEIQITTQLQEVIRKLIHKYYEEKRKQIRTEAVKWQWAYESDEFIANYLGHILHYVEGMIMEVRQRQARNGKE